MTPPIPTACVLDPTRFEEQLAMLRRRRYEFVSAADLVAILQGDAVPPARTAVLTFDDGWIDAVTEVAPRLARHASPPRSSSARVGSAATIPT